MVDSGLLEQFRALDSVALGVEGGDDTEEARALPG